MLLLSAVKIAFLASLMNDASSLTFARNASALAFVSAYAFFVAASFSSVVASSARVGTFVVNS